MIALAQPTPDGAQIDNRPIDRVAELGKTISASRLGLWLGCRLKFYFRYFLQIKKPTTPSMHAGSTVHAVLQAWNMARWRQEPFALEQFKTLFGRQWTALQEGDQIKWNDEEEDERTSAWRALEHYFTETPIKANERPEAVEVSVEADLCRRASRPSLSVCACCGVRCAFTSNQSVPRRRSWQPGCDNPKHWSKAEPSVGQGLTAT